MDLRGTVNADKEPLFLRVHNFVFWTFAPKHLFVSLFFCLIQDNTTNTEQTGLQKYLFTDFETI